MEIFTVLNNFVLGLKVKRYDTGPRPWFKYCCLSNKAQLATNHQKNKFKHSTWYFPIRTGLCQASFYNDNCCVKNINTWRSEYISGNIRICIPSFVIAASLWSHSPWKKGTNFSCIVNMAPQKAETIAVVVLAHYPGKYRFNPRMFKKWTTNNFQMPSTWMA